MAGVTHWIGEPSDFILSDLGIVTRTHPVQVGGARHRGGQPPLHPAELAAAVGPAPESADRRGAEELIRPPNADDESGPRLGC
jgi:hypothetical protein